MEHQHELADIGGSNMLVMVAGKNISTLVTSVIERRLSNNHYSNNANNKPYTSLSMDYYYQ
ncbi:hypothetical protein TCAL_16485 [Tigriopus californicus]|uniref:Uncharacterized protein n=1 Tax=Tigriopus californicus TaxID=6832 RepID=A0A553NUC9_TIGCA|nr:hypothetical protein TCAL_16485 [Tigriopus californicus]